MNVIYIYISIKYTMKWFRVAKKNQYSTNSLWFKLSLKLFKKFNKAKTGNQTVWFGQNFPKLEAGNSVLVWFKPNFPNTTQASPFFLFSFLSYLSCSSASSSSCLLSCLSSCLVVVME